MSELDPASSAGPPVGRRLLDNGGRFTLYKALCIAEHQWSLGEELTAGLSRQLQIISDEELVFAGREITGCKQEPRSGIVTLQTAVSGLLGCNSPLPSYLQTLAAGDDIQGRRLRAFLFAFNHLLYCQGYQAWKKSRPTLPGHGARVCELLWNNLLGDGGSPRLSSGIAVGRKLSSAALCQMLRHELGLSLLWVDDDGAEWHPMASLSVIGEPESTRLGDTAVLGQRVRVAGQWIVVRIGPIGEVRAKALSPGGTQGERLARLLRCYVASTLFWRVELSVTLSTGTGLGLGSPGLRLGTNSYLGRPLLAEEKRYFESSRFTVSLGKPQSGDTVAAGEETNEQAS